MDWDKVDWRSFADNDRPRDKSDKDIIAGGGVVPCRICDSMFGRLRLTKRYCGKCFNGFCEGEHGTFSQGRGAYCVQCEE